MKDDAHKEWEKKALLRKILPISPVKKRALLTKFGQELDDEYCNQFDKKGYNSQHEKIDRKKALNHVATSATDEQLLHLFSKWEESLSARKSFCGKYYTYYPERKELKLGSAWPVLQSELEGVYEEYGHNALPVLQAILDCIEAGVVNDNIGNIKTKAKENGAEKGYTDVLRSFETCSPIQRYKSSNKYSVRISEELIPLIKETISQWRQRKSSSSLEKEGSKVSRHKVLEEVIAAYPSEIFDEELTLVEKSFKLDSGDEIDLLFKDKGGTPLIVEIKPSFEEKGFSQLQRYQDEYAKEKGTQKRRIRKALVCSEVVRDKFLSVAQNLDIEVFRLRIIGEKIE